MIPVVNIREVYWTISMRKLVKRAKGELKGELNIDMDADVKTKQKLCERTIICEFELYINELCGNINKGMFKYGGAYADQL